ncbi:hypothetical protein F5887DRAFT_917830 [Amanita rubescens]|nr:hypothetical protein F5887DRAFT_917830 [Amanita rubescens]
MAVVNNPDLNLIFNRKSPLEKRRKKIGKAAEEGGKPVEKPRKKKGKGVESWREPGPIKEERSREETTEEEEKGRWRGYHCFGEWNGSIERPRCGQLKRRRSCAPNDLEGCISLDAGCLGSLESGWADEPKADGDVVQAQIPDSGRALAAVCVLMVAAVIVGMENLENGTLHELNEEMNDTGQHTLKEPSTIDAQVITEGVQSIAFDAEACLADVEPHLDDPGGSLMLCALIDDENREICWRNKRLVSANENFIFDGEKDVLGLDSIVDESRGSDSLEGLNPDGISIEDVQRKSNRAVVITESVWDVGWRSSPWHYVVNNLRLDALWWVVALIGWPYGFAQVFEAKRDPNRSIDSWALSFMAVVNAFFGLSGSIKLILGVRSQKGHEASPSGRALLCGVLATPPDGLRIPKLLRYASDMLDLLQKHSVGPLSTFNSPHRHNDRLSPKSIIRTRQRINKGLIDMFSQNLISSAAHPGSTALAVYASKLSSLMERAKSSERPPVNTTIANAPDRPRTWQHLKRSSK